jgi:hypothetical protein
LRCLAVSAPRKENIGVHKKISVHTKRISPTDSVKCVCHSGQGRDSGQKKKPRDGIARLSDDDRAERQTQSRSFSNPL